MKKVILSLIIFSVWNLPVKCDSYYPLPEAASLSSSIVKTEEPQDPYCYDKSGNLLKNVWIPSERSNFMYYCDSKGRKVEERMRTTNYNNTYSGYNSYYYYQDMYPARYSRPYLYGSYGYKKHHNGNHKGISYYYKSNPKYIHSHIKSNSTINNRNGAKVNYSAGHRPGYTSNYAKGAKIYR